MADPLSITASLVGLGGAAIKTATTLFRFSETIYRARKQINALATELAHFAIAPKSLARVLDEHGSLLEPRLLDEVNVHIRECRSILRSIKRDFSVSTSQELTLLDRTKWYFRDEKVKRIQARLERAKASSTLIVGILNLAACLRRYKTSTRATHGHPERIQERYEDAALFVDVTCRAFETNRELEVETEDEELEDDEVYSESDLSLHFGGCDNRAITQPLSGTRETFPAVSTRTNSTFASTACNPRLSTNNSPLSTISRQHTSPGRAPAVVRQLLLCWTSVEDVSPLPTAPGHVAHIEIEDLSLDEEGAARVQEATVNSFHSPSNATQSGIDLSRTRASSSLSLNRNNPGPQSRIAAPASSPFRGLHSPSDITRPFTPSRGRKVNPSNYITNTNRTDTLPPIPKNGVQVVRDMCFDDGRFIGVPVACMNTFSWSIRDRPWDLKYLSYVGEGRSLKLLNFCVRHRSFTGYFAIPWDAAECWEETRYSMFRKWVPEVMDKAGVGSIIPAACFFLMEGHRARLLEASQQGLESHPMVETLAQEVEDARTAYNMVSQDNFVLYRMKRFRTGPNDRADRQRIHRSDWDQELARSDYHVSEFYIKIKLGVERPSAVPEKHRSSRAIKTRYTDKKGENSDQHPSMTLPAAISTRIRRNTAARKPRESVSYDY
ncbi:hypothetical protein MMC17_009196 [Xylographa soralifera]|nr:hypothetical protein [Xylographa soralifera]